jgi:subtilase family serine protease
MRTKSYTALVTVAIMSLFMAFIAVAMAHGQTVERFLPTRHVREAAVNGRAPLVGVLPGTQRMRLAIALPLHNQAELNDLLRRLYDPQSSSYHQYLSVREFTERFGPSREDYESVVHFAEANGMTVEGRSRNRLVLDLTASVSDIERTFHVTMGVYQHPTENRTFYAPDREPTFDLDVPLWHIGGLDNYSIPRALYKRAEASSTVRGNTTGSGPGGNFLGSDRRAAYYGGTALTGSGQAVGLFALDGYNIGDVQAYFRTVGQPLNVPINNVLLNGASAGSNGDDTEQVIDIIEAISMAPALSQVRVYIAHGGNAFRSGTDDTDIFNRMATENIAKQLSCSFAWKPADASHDDPIFQEFAAQGQSLFVASGDQGSFTSGDFLYPAEDPLITAVGGTVLTTNRAGGSWLSETGWIGSGGGPSPDGATIPSYQQIPGIINSSNRGSTSLRNVPDVAAEANTDNFTCANGICGGGLGGTSLAAPTWAGYLALTNQQTAAEGKAPVGFINPLIYPIAVSSTYLTDFHDITSGSNGAFSAVSGYDLVTGLGSPNGVNLINELANFSRAATGILGFAGQFSCQDNQTCDAGTISVTVNNTTETISYDGTGFFTGTGFGISGAPGIPQTIAQTLVDTFNGDPNSPVNASLFDDTYINGFDVKFTAKQTGTGGDYSTSIAVTSNYGSFQVFGPASIAWTWTPFPATGGADPNTLTEVTPLGGGLTGGR